jgi:hypothetical protein
MKLGKLALINKFKNLEKFKDQKWFSEEALKSDCNYKELPLHAAKMMIKDMIKFCEQTKFNSTWELNFSVKIRLIQLQDLLDHFCDQTDYEKTLNGSNLNQPDPNQK